MKFEDSLRIAFSAPLQEGDSLDKTVGCRHTNPEICGSAYLETVCAFSRTDKMCLHPSRAWKKQYTKLMEGKADGA